MRTITITPEHIALIRVLNWTLSDEAPKVNQNQPFTAYSDAYEAITKHFGNVTPMQVDEIMQEINVAVMILAQNGKLTSGDYELTKTGWIELPKYRKGLIYKDNFKIVDVSIGKYPVLFILCLQHIITGELSIEHIMVRKKTI